MGQGPTKRFGDRKSGLRVDPPCRILMRRSQAWGLRNRWFADSSLEGDGFEPSVPSCDRQVRTPEGRSPGRKYLHSLHSLGSGVLFNAGPPRGTGSSNPPLSREESANHRFLSPHACDRRRRRQDEPFGAFQCGYQPGAAECCPPLGLPFPRRPTILSRCCGRCSHGRARPPLR